MPKTPYRRRGLLFQPVDNPAAWRELARLARQWVGPERLSDHVIKTALSKARHAIVIGQPGPINPCTLLAEAVAHRLNPPPMPGGRLRVGIDPEAFQAASDNCDDIIRRAERVLDICASVEVVNKALSGR